MKPRWGPGAWVFWGLFVAWFVVLFVLSSRNLPRIPGNDIPHIDKVYHAGYFFVGGWILIGALASSFEMSLRRLSLTTLAVIALIGVFDEVHQLFTPARQGGDKGDWIADFSGGLLAVGAFWVWNRRIRPFLKNNV